VNGTAMKGETELMSFMVLGILEKSSTAYLELIIDSKSSDMGGVLLNARPLVCSQIHST
jgi:hypothetical protein